MMPPKKRAKLDSIAETSTARGVKSTKSSAKTKSAGKSGGSKTSSIKTRSQLKQGISPIIQAAQGAGIFTTEQLQDKLRDSALKAVAEDAVDIAADTAAVDELAPDYPGLTSVADEAEEGHDPSDSESEGEIHEAGTPEDTSPGLRRQITYDHERQCFTSTALSPGSLDRGKDTRDLAKLQEILDSNPDAINTLDVMIQALKSTNSDNADNAVNTAAQAQPPQELQGQRLPPPPPGNLNQLINQTSETTIYTHAVPSASPSHIPVAAHEPLHHACGTIASIPQVSSDPEISFAGPRDRHQVPDAQPGTSDHLEQQRTERTAAKARTDALLLAAQRQRTELARPAAGMSYSNNDTPVELNQATTRLARVQLLSSPGSHDLKCDDKLFQLTAHIDDQTLDKIQNGEYVDFAKLLPRETVVTSQEKGKFQIVDEDGKPAFAPYVPKDAYTITCFKRWELAFDVFAKIYADAFPRRAPELLEYKHIIRRGAESFPWLHVYNYDQIFRQFIEKNPGRTWAKKHHETWSNHVTDSKLSPNTNPDRDVKRTKPPCRFFNKNGNCKRGRNCDHDHRCSFCFMFGHGRYNCHKLQKKNAQAASTSTSVATMSGQASSASN